MKENNFINEALAYLDRIGIKYEIDNNPSPEKIKLIKEQLKRKEEYLNSFKK